MAKFEDSLGREGFQKEGAPAADGGAGPAAESRRFAPDSPFPAFRMIAAGSRPIEPEQARPTPLMKILPIAAAAVVAAVALAWWLR